MSCPFMSSSLNQVKEMDAALRAQNPHTAANGTTTPPRQTTTTSNDTSPVRTTSNGQAVLSSPQVPLGLWTGGLRTSLGVENAHPLKVWMKEMQARGGLKGVDIEKELQDLDLPPAADGDASLDPLIQAQQEKNWKQKRERPPIEFPGGANTTVHEPPTGITSEPTQTRIYPGLFAGRMNHNSHQGQNPMSKYDQEITYWNYIHPEVLTSLQNGRQGKGLNHHDEHLFILIHQTFELWFKQILWELEYVRNCLLGYRDPLLPSHPQERNPLARCVQRLARADKILRLATEGYGIMETMDPGDFLEFRDFLSPSSGFQSVQFRELEILLGLKDEDRIQCAGRHYREAFMANGENKTGVFDRRLKKEKTLKDSLYYFLSQASPSTELDKFKQAYFKVLHTQNTEKSKDFEEELELLSKMLERSSLDGREKKYLEDLKEKAKFGKQLAKNSSEDVAKFFDDPVLGKQRSSILFLFTYHSHPSLKDTAELCEGILKFEQAVLLWRQRHARMVESFIGRRPGTGGSSGVEYIDQTANQYRIFTDLWRIRSLCVARSKISYDPDAGALWQGSFMEKLESDYAKVEAAFNEEQRQAKERTKEYEASLKSTTTV